MSKRFLTCVLVLALFFTYVVIAAPAAAARTSCERSAHQMRLSCRAEATEEYYAALAICNLISDPDARTACNDDAADARAEAKNEECEAMLDARLEACDLLGETRHIDPLTDPGNVFVDLDEIGDTVPPNPFFSLEVGHTYVLRAGEDFEETVVVTVTDETAEVNGRDCRVVVDVVVVEDEDEDEEGIEYVPVEVTDDLYAQLDNGDVVYCGEVTAEFEDGFLIDTAGSFRSGFEGGHAGLLIQSSPRIGDAHRQELSYGEAEDVIEYVDDDGVPTAAEGGENGVFPCAPGGCLVTRDTAALEPDTTELKFFKEDVGFVLAVPLEDGEPTGEREELVCVGDSLAILEDPACGIEDVVGLLEELCELSPDAFCADDDAD